MAYSIYKSDLRALVVTIVLGSKELLKAILIGAVREGRNFKFVDDVQETVVDINKVFPLWKSPIKETSKVLGQTLFYGQLFRHQDGKPYCTCS